jgi:tRNA(Ile)-lysidine synthase
VALVDELLSRSSFGPADAPVTCAVSGGADSLALLALACAHARDVTAVHVDHGLRAQSAGEADVVAAAASRFGARFEGVQVRVDQGPNLEARARAARFSVLPADVCTGHTADDQAETVLLNLLRGAALDGLAGMARGPRHPILALRRAETHALCAELGVEVVHDPSNDDRRFLRNALRHDILPLLDELAQRDVAAVLARQSDLVRDDVDLLNALAHEVDVVDARVLAGSPTALARRAVRLWLTPALGGHPPDAAAVERVLGVARGDARACDVSEGLRVSRSGGRLTLRLP